MRLLGLHVIDWLVIAGYFVAMLWIGAWARRRVRNTRAFYQGDRSFGRSLVAFLNFGSMTDAGQTAGVTSEIFRQGLQGVWFQNLVLFHTPFQWFIAALERRARYLAPGDLFLHRFESRFLAGLYAVVLIPMVIYGNSFGFLLTGKTLQAIMAKPTVEYTAEERTSVAGFEELRSLRKLDFKTLDADKRTQLTTLEEREKRGELRAFASYLDLTTFYIFYAVMIAAYTALGGLLAVAIMDVVQGVLIVFLSLALIPAALERIGGLSGLQASVPERMFDVFGASATSDYTWYFVASFSFLNLVVNAPKRFMIGGAAKDDRAARLGFVTGSVFKRFMMVAWALTGLLAIGLYSGEISDPTNVWGFMTRDILGVGLVGLMIAAVFSANMDGSSTASLESSAAVVKNIIEPMAPTTSERTQVIVGRVVLVTVLGVSVLFASKLNNLLSIFSYALSVGTIIGPSIWLAFFWRRLNTRAVAAQMLISLAIVGVLPHVVPAIDAFARDPALTMRTDERFVPTEVRATEENVKAGAAAAVGERITKQERVAPVAIFFDKVIREKPDDTTSALVGKDFFRTQIWILGRLGIDFRSWSNAQIRTASALFDAILPFIILFLVSPFTRKNSEHVLRDFYARVHTPAVADPELDARLVLEKTQNPELVEQDKIFPGSDWEFWKPTRFDILGFLACVGFVLVVIGLYMLLGSLG